MKQCFICHSVRRPGEISDSYNVYHRSSYRLFFIPVHFFADRYNAQRHRSSSCIHSGTSRKHCRNPELLLESAQHEIKHEI